MPTLTRGVYPVGDAGNVVPNWFPPAFDTYVPGVGLPTNPFLLATPQVIGVFDTRPEEKPEQPETHKEIAWSASPGGVVLRLNAPFNTVFATTPDGTISAGQTFSGGWPAGGSLRLWVGGVDYFHAADQPAQYGYSTPINVWAGQIRPSNVDFPAPIPDGVDAELLRYLQSGNQRFEPYSATANPRQRRIFEALLNSSNTYDLSGILGGAAGAPVQVDIASLAGGARYVWIALDFVALPAPELAVAAAPGGNIRPPFLWDTYGLGVRPRFDVPWTTRAGRCQMDIEPPEVRIVIPNEIGPDYPGPGIVSVSDFAYWGSQTRNGISFTARGCRGRKRFHVFPNGFYNRQQTEAFSTLMARVTANGGSSFVQDIQRPAVYSPIDVTVPRDPWAQPTVPVWGYLHDIDVSDPITAGHTGQVSSVTVELWGIRPSFTVPFAAYPYGTSPACIVTLGD